MWYIIVKVEEEQYVVRHSYKEFDTLHKHSLTLFGDSELLPEFPMFASATINIDIRMRKLAEYLMSLCRDEFISDCLLDFLQMKDEYRALLIYQRDMLMNPEQSDMQSSKERSDSYSIHYYNPTMHSEFLTNHWEGNSQDLSIFFQVSLEFKEKSHFIITWSSSQLREDGQALKHFNDLSSLHNSYIQLNFLISLLRVFLSFDKRKS